MKHSMQTRFIAALLALLVGACSAEGDQPDILDAAEIFAANPDAFAEILLTYPRPLTEFTRIPARDPAKETVGNTRFLNRLRKTMPVEFIDFFPRSAEGRDEVNVVLNRYTAQDDWVVVSLIYISKPLGSPNAGENKALFDRCDERSLTWLSENRANGSATAICQLNNNWYAVQKIG